MTVDGFEQRLRLKVAFASEAVAEARASSLGCWSLQPGHGSGYVEGVECGVGVAEYYAAKHAVENDDHCDDRDAVPCGWALQSERASYWAAKSLAVEDGGHAERMAKEMGGV